MSWVPKSHWWAALSTAITVHLFASELHEQLPHLTAEGLAFEPFARLVAYALFMSIAVQWLYLARMRFLGQVRTRELTKEDPAEKRARLVLFLSNLAVAEDDRNAGAPASLTEPWELERHLSNLEGQKRNEQGRQRNHWPWEMPLRAMRHHLPVLKGVSIICSPQSIRQVHWFCTIAKRYNCFAGVELQVVRDRDGTAGLEGAPTARIEDGGIAFDEFDELWRVVSQAVKQMLRRPGVTEHDIMIDFTGGSKVPSVVAAAITFSRNIKAQYVDTNPPHDVVSYDLVTETAYESGPEV